MIDKLLWLKKDQRLFLDRGYLVPGVTPEQRYQKICDTVQLYVDKMSNGNTPNRLKSIGKRFETYIENNWTSFSTPILANFGETFNLPISCVAEDTWINTKGGGKMAKDISIGDEVLTHKGRFRKIIDIIPTENKSDIYKLKVVSRMTDLYITGNHPVKTNLGWVRVDELDPLKHLVAVNNEVEFGEDSEYEINMKKFVSYNYDVVDGFIKKVVERTQGLPEKTVARLNKDKNYVTYYTDIPEKVKVTQDVAWLIGLFFADGNISKNKDKKPIGIRLTQSIGERDFCQKWCDIIKSNFNCNSSIYQSKVKSKYSKRGEAEWLTVNSNSIVLGEFFNSFGGGALDKLIPDWVLSLPKNKIFSFLDGLFHGDGCIKTDGTCALILSNPKLLLQVYNLCLKVGYKVSLQMQSKAGKFNTTRYVYALTIRDYRPSRARFKPDSGVEFEDGLIYCPIRKLEKTDLVKNVYDFTVEEDHSFSCAGVVVHNCNKSVMPDSIDQIASTIHETMMLAKHGAGTAIDFSYIRPQGSDISSGGKSNSVLDWIELAADAISKTSQGSRRRGFLTAYLRVDHPEIMEFLKIGTHKMPSDKQRFFQTITTGIIFPPGWLKDVKENPEKRKIFTEAINSRSEIGYPYMFDMENANNSAPQYMKDLGLTIKNSNICCVSGGTKVLTSIGHVEIADVVGEKMSVWNGEEFSENVEILKTGTNKTLYRVEFSNGSYLDCTDNHNFYVKNHYSKSSEKIPLYELNIGDKLEKFSLPVIRGQKEMLYPYTHGFYCGDGCNPDDRSDNTAFIYLYEGKKDLLPYIARRNKFESGTHTLTDIEAVHECEKRITIKVPLNMEKSKTFVPNSNYTINTRLRWLEGIFDSDGCSTRSNSNSVSLQLGSVNKDFLCKIQLMLQTLGVNSKVVDGMPEGFRLLPKNDGSGENKKYWCKKAYRLLITSYGVKQLVELGINFKRVDISNNNPNRDCTNLVKVLSIKELPGLHDTYCFTEPKKGKGIFNGVLTGQCETAGYTDNDTTFACDLSSVNAALFHEWRDDPNFLFDQYVMLDCVVEEYIDKTANIPGFRRARNYAVNFRGVGLGVTGFHTLLQRNMIPVGSLESYRINDELFKSLHDAGEESSKQMAKWWGEAPAIKGYGYRNTQRQAQAPKKSTSFIDGGTELGYSEGIEMHKSNYMEKKYAKIQVTFKNKELEALLESREKNTPYVWDSILLNNGSVQHLNFLSNHEKEVFKTFSETSQLDIIKLAAARQKYITQGQSINLMIHPKTPKKDVIKLHITAFEEGLKGLYYQYSINAVQEFNKDLLECSSCEG